MIPGLSGLFERRLLIVTGKGGTGKTTLAAALGILAARQGIDVVGVEIGEEAALAALLSSDGQRPHDPAGREPIELAPHLFTLRIVPEVALTEYLGLQLHTEALASRILAALVESAHVERLDPSGAAVVSIAVSPEMLDDFATLGADLEDLEPEPAEWNGDEYDTGGTSEEAYSGQPLDMAACYR